MSLVNYLQLLIIMCRRYCAGITLMNSVLKLKKSSWWEKGQDSLLLGCVGQRGLVGQQLKQARKVECLCIPSSTFFLYLDPCSLPSATPKPPSLPFPPFPCSSVTCLYPTSHCLQQSCLNRLCWCPQWATELQEAPSAWSLPCTSSQQFQLFVTKDRCLL